MVRKVAEPLTERNHAQALALSRSREQGVEPRAERLTHGRRDRRQFLRELVERVAQAEAKACTREQRPQTARRAVKAIRQDAADPIGRLLLVCRALKRAVRLGKGRRACLLSVPEMPEHAATDNRGQIHLVSETAAVLLICQEIYW